MYTKSSSSVIESTYASSSFFSTACSLCTTSRTKSSGSGTGRTLPPTHVESKCFPPPSSSSSTPSNEGVRRIIRRTVMRTNCALQHRFPVQLQKNCNSFPANTFSGATPTPPPFSDSESAIKHCWPGFRWSWSWSSWSWWFKCVLSV